MNKLTEIKQKYEHADKRSTPAIGTRYYHISMDDLGYLISLLEEKDKALAFYADRDNYDFNGRYSIPMFNDNGDIARKALNTSSNSEGE